LRLPGAAGRCDRPVSRKNVYGDREIQIQPGSAADLKQSITVLGGGSTLDVVIESDSRILQSDKLLTTVAKTLKLQNDPVSWAPESVRCGVFRQKDVPAAHGNLDDPFVSSGIVGNLRAHLTIARSHARR